MPCWLSKDELVYEHRIRGLSIATVEEMRSTLASALQNERLNPEIISKYPSHPYTVEQDEEDIKEKLEEVSELLNREILKKDLKKLESKLCHISGRIKRMSQDSDERVDFLKMVVEMTTIFLEAREKIRKPPELQLLEQSLDQALNLSASSLQPEAISQEGRTLARASTPLNNNTSVKTVPVYKWGIKFDGTGSVNAFLERVEELMVARNVDDRQVFASALDLFEGNALKWYRNNRKQLEDWEHLVQQLRNEFQPLNYNEKLFSEIKQRTQGLDESVGTYLDNMEALFSRLTCTISATAKLKIMLDNLQPFYQSQLALIEINSTDHLRKLCKQLEARKEVVQNFAPPSRRQKHLEPDLAYLDVTNTNLEDEDVAGVSRFRTSERKCFNCGSPSHFIQNCPRPRVRKCFRCGEMGSTVLTCSKCSGNGAGRYRRIVATVPNQS